MVEVRKKRKPKMSRFKTGKGEKPVKAKILQKAH